MPKALRVSELEDKIISLVSQGIEEHGHAIVTIHGMAALFGHSNSTIHKTVRRMEREGKLVAHPGRPGCYHEVVRDGAAR